MATVCPVKFPYAARDLWFDASGLEIRRGDPLVCSTARGTEFGIATGEPEEWDEERVDETLGGEALSPVLRHATPEDEALAADRDEQGREAMPVFQEAIVAHGLPMKAVGVEYLFGLERVICYFVAEGRIDFRALARDLSQKLELRVDMHQLGPREQSSIMGGIAHCGQEFCCSRLGQGFGTVTIRMAKDQDLPLSSPKISGACGRLMCCLRYENEAYRDFKGRAPKKNARIDTPMGEARVTELDTPREAVTLRLENDKSFRVPVACMECSERARETAERNGSPCRPDRVTRDALEALDSPQVRLALAQLEADEELEAEALLPPEDMLIEEPSRPVRRRRRSGAAESEKGEHTSEATEAAPRRRRRRRSRTTEGSEAPTGAAGPENAADGKPARSRRRRRGSGRAQAATASAPQGSVEEAAPEQRRSNRRRRPRKDAARPEGEARAPKPQKTTPSGDEAAEKPKRRRSRRRGGRGRGRSKAQGAQARASQAQTQARGGASKPAKESSNGRGGSGASAGDARPGRSRRRHRRAGSGGGGGTTPPAADAS